jgi:hypothetical protein
VDFLTSLGRILQVAGYGRQAVDLGSAAVLRVLLEHKVRKAIRLAGGVVMGIAR